MREKVMVVIVATGIEVIGEVYSYTDHTITLASPCVLPDPENLILIGNYVPYAKMNKVMFNRDMLIGEYEPSEEIVTLYTTFIKHDTYKVSKELVSESIQTEHSALTTQTEEAVEELSTRRTDKLTGPKVMEIKDVLAQIQAKVKKKLN